MIISHLFFCCCRSNKNQLRSWTVSDDNDTTHIHTAVVKRKASGHCVSVERVGKRRVHNSIIIYPFSLLSCPFACFLLSVNPFSLDQSVCVTSSPVLFCFDSIITLSAAAVMIPFQCFIDLYFSLPERERESNSYFHYSDKFDNRNMWLERERGSVECENMFFSLKLFLLLLLP